MSKIKTEKYVRHQIRKILNSDLLYERSEILGGGGTGGRYPKDLMAAFGGEKIGDLLSRKNPQKLMNQLQMGKVAGDDDYERLLNALKQGVEGREEMQAAYGTSFVEKKDSVGRKGIYVKVKDISTASGRFFLRELLMGALGANFMNLDGHARVEIAEGGILVYPVENKTERWGAAK